MDWFDISILGIVALTALALGYWASQRICDALDWLSGDLCDATRLSDADLKAIRRELTSR